MNILQLRFVNIGLFFLLIFASGYWLHHSGKPYGAILFNFHKLIGFGLFVFLVVRLVQFHRAMPLTAIEWLVCAAAALSFLVTIVFGGLVSIDRSWHAAIPVLHNVLPYVTLLTTLASLVILFGQR